MVDEGTTLRPAPGQPPEQVYPLAFSVDYPERLSRVSTAFRLILVIPILAVVAALIGPAVFGDDGALTATFAVEPYFRVTVPNLLPAAGLLVVAPLLMILFRRKYPRWWFDWNLQLLRFHNRISVYALVLRDEYPSTDDEQAVHLHVPYPDAVELSRWLPLAKWLLSMPHYIVLIGLNLLAVLAVVVAWFAILITGRYPRSLFDFVVGVLRWNNRVIAYAFMLATDHYPPFRLRP